MSGPENKYGTLKRLEERYGDSWYNVFRLFSIYRQLISIAALGLIGLFLYIASFFWDVSPRKFIESFSSPRKLSPLSLVWKIDVPPPLQRLRIPPWEKSATMQKMKMPIVLTVLSNGVVKNWDIDEKREIQDTKQAAFTNPAAAISFQPASFSGSEIDLAAFKSRLNTSDAVGALLLSTIKRRHMKADLSIFNIADGLNTIASGTRDLHVLANARWLTLDSRTKELYEEALVSESSKKYLGGTDLQRMNVGILRAFYARELKSDNVQVDPRAVNIRHTWFRQIGEPGGVVSELAPDESQVAVGEQNGEIRVYKFVDQTLDFTLYSYFPVQHLEFSSDSYVLGAISGNNKIDLWDLSNSQRISDFIISNTMVRDIHFAHEGESLYAGGDDGVLHTINWRTGKILQSRTITRGGINSLAMSPNDKYLVTGHTDNSVVLWDVATGEIKKVLQDSDTTVPSGSRGVIDMAFCLAGKQLVAGFQNGEVKFWDVSTLR